MMPIANDGGKAKSDSGWIGFTGEREAMARYKHIDLSPRLMALLQRQLLPGTFEHALHHLIESELDLSHFDARFRNESAGRLGLSTLDAAEGGAVWVFAGAGLKPCHGAGLRGADDLHCPLGRQPAALHDAGALCSVSEEDIARVFGAVLCDLRRPGLIGREMFAVDGVKLSSNASKARERHAGGL